MSSVSTSNHTTMSTRQDSQQSFTKKPPPLAIKKSSQDAMTSVPLSASSGQKTPPILSAGASAPLDVKEKKIGHRRVDEQTGQVTYKKKTTSDLMHAIQLGIGQSVGSLTSKPNRDVLMQDFSVVESVHFPENGSNLTPAHRVGEFRFKTYAPIAFRYFRELFGIQTDDFLISLTGLPLTELSNPGASGSVFFITEDDEFIIKTVQHKEADFLQKLLPGYYMNLNQNPRTLLPKFYGLYCLQSGGKNIRLCVMNNLLPAAIRKSEKYDLKGSTYKRKASKHELAKSSPTYKDLDFRERNPDGISLEADTYEALMKTVKRDCRVLESFKIMDYSLLMCMYNVDEAKRRQQVTLKGSIPATTRLPHSLNEQPSTSRGAGGAEGNIATPGMITRGRSTKQRLQQFSTAMESIQADAADPVELDDEDVPPGGIPARSAQGERLLLYIGIIDILQSYRLKKKLEHGFKSIVYDGDSISVHRPSFYAQRFQTFFEKEVFRKIVSLQQIKKLPALQQVQAAHNYSAIRSPSKKKSTTRQRSLTETSTTAAAGVSNDAAGSLLHKNKPDLIPQVSEDDSQPSMSTNAFDPRWSGTTMSSVQTYSSSSASTVIRGGYTTTQSKELTAALHPVKEHDLELPPQHEDPLPPYSEEAPTVEASGGARSKHTNLQVPSSSEPSKTVSAPSVLGQNGEALTKSAIRREKADGSDGKKGVRFSSHSEDEALENDKLLPSPDATGQSQQAAAQSEVQPVQQEEQVSDLPVNTSSETAHQTPGGAATRADTVENMNDSSSDVNQAESDSNQSISHKLASDKHSLSNDVEEMTNEAAN